MQESDSQKPLDVAATSFLGLFDGLLRRRESYFESIFEGENVGPLIRWCLLATVLLGGLYGAAMGAAGFVNGPLEGFLQVGTSALKVPLLFLMSLLVCYPVLYFVIVLMGSRLSFSQTLALILIAVTMNAILLAGCAPIVLFFIFTGSGYAFVKLLHVGIFAFSGCWAMMALWHGLTAMCEKSDLYPKQAIKILQMWILVYGFVGTQMAWSFRPFIGSPDKPFEFLRQDQGSNFYQAIGYAVMGLFDRKDESDTGFTPLPQNEALNSPPSLQNQGANVNRGLSVPPERLNQVLTVPPLTLSPGEAEQPSGAPDGDGWAPVSPESEK